LDDLDETAMTKPEDLRTSLVHYLDNPDHVTYRKIWWQSLNYILLDHDLYHRTIDALLLRCLGSDQSKVALGEFMMKYAVHINRLL
jgi:hypothetical protein